MHLKEPEKTKIEAQTSQAPKQESQIESALVNQMVPPTHQRRIKAMKKNKRNPRCIQKCRYATKADRTAIVSVEGANVRRAPYLEAQRILNITKGEMLTVTDERIDHTGMKWYKVLLYNNREGWIADKVVSITLIK